MQRRGLTTAGDARRRGAGLAVMGGTARVAEKADAERLGGDRIRQTMEVRIMSEFCLHCGRPLAAGGGKACLPDPPPCANGGHRLRYLLVKSAEVLRMLQVAEIDWIEAEGHHVRISVRGEVITVRQRIRSLELALDPVQFPRIHR